MKLPMRISAPTKAISARPSVAPGTKAAPSSDGPTIRPSLVQLQSRGDTSKGTGLPNRLRTGIEALSGLSLADVNVHYNSAEPARLNALAYAAGTDIHVGPGQERHLPHEAWHLVQQAQGRVRPSIQMKDSVAVNDDAGLEREADVMGARAATAGAHAGPSAAPVIGVTRASAGTRPLVAQLKICPHCGWEGGHSPSCTAQSRASATAEREEANRQQHDQSLDSRTREDQSHRQHGGDAKGRQRKYDRWSKK